MRENLNRVYFFFFFITVEEKMGKKKKNWKLNLEMSFFCQ